MNPAISTPASRSWLRRIARHVWFQWIRPLALPLFAIAAAKSALADINFVPTGSMKPTILEGDIVFINKLAYDLRVPFTKMRVARWSEPARGDIVVCFAPDDGTRLVKRVIALPGDTLAVREDKVFLNGVPQLYRKLSDSAAGVRYLAPAERDRAVLAEEKLFAQSHAVMTTPTRPALRNFGPITIPAGHYFVLGDQRDNSRDSRFFGPVPGEEIIGQATAVVVSADLAHRWRPRFGRFCTALD